jgi:hypothetical protein
LTPGAGITETSPANGQGNLYQFLMSYVATDVLGPGGNGPMTGETAGLTGSGVPNGNVEFVKAVRTATGSSLGSPAVEINTSPTNTGTSTANFAPQTSITILDSVNVNSGTTAGAQATLNSFYNQLAVATVPEPGTYILLGGAFTLLGVLRRRTPKRA